jgi:hypothetical protein
LNDRAVAKILNHFQAAAKPSHQIGYVRGDAVAERLEASDEWEKHEFYTSCREI